ncbi:hypothetical protein LIER_42874 [Lithospermum erythrorhizon]|uniref:Uncharacterized protein n=1 Tax=Lithospermum erythrorhizon TaxID=34254 RepID=A0AAV3P201_LITER
MWDGNKHPSKAHSYVEVRSDEHMLSAKNARFVEVLDCCNGLVYLMLRTTDKEECPFLLNPSTMRFQTMSKIDESTMPSKDPYNLVVYGFGYDL